MKSLTLLFCITASFSILGQNNDSLSFIFIGDIMGHTPQIKAAYDAETGEYNYNSVFREVAPIIKKADFAIANLEVTLAGPPYLGYPQFSSPDALAYACKHCGIDVLVTANNHCCDRRKTGITRTIKVLDSLKIYHTGTFKDSVDRVQNNLLILNKNNIKVGILNYTYGTNGIATPSPTVINRIDTTQMLTDIENSRDSLLDKLIVVIHWGYEYHSHPSNAQKQIADFLFNNGVDIIIGSHPHVLQKMEYFPFIENQKEQLIVYSLGNFVSNQRKQKCDGGAMIKFTLSKRQDKIKITNPGYYLIWVNKTEHQGKTNYCILPCSQIEKNAYEGLDSTAIKKMDVFTSDSRALFATENINVPEIKFDNRLTPIKPHFKTLEREDILEKFNLLR